MNGSFANAAKVTLESFGRLSFDYASLIITVVYLTPMLLFNNLLVVVTAMEKSIVGTLRILLVNIVTAGQIVTMGMIMAYTANVIIIGHCCPKLRPSDFACRWMYWAIASGGAARLMYMTTFAISVYVLVRYGAKKMKIWVAIVAVVCVWVAVLLPNTAIFSQDVVLINFHDNNTCAAHGTGYKAYIYAFGYTTVYGLLGFTVSIVCAIATVWFIRHNTTMGDITLVKAMMKFSVFLILGNIINFVGQTTPLLLLSFAPASKEQHSLEKVFLYVEEIFVLLSLVTTPVLILIYFKPVRKRIKHILCSVYMKTAVSEKSIKLASTGSTKNANSANANMYM